MKNNKGISLIVLVITIIVMVILAGAIILTLNNSGIIGKASEAVDKMNEAQLKQVAQTYYAEYIIEGPNQTAHEYVKSKMRTAGIGEEYVERIIVYDDGKTIVGASKIAVKLFEANVPVGAKISGYDISGNEVKSYTTDGKEYMTEAAPTGTAQTINVATDVSWTYMGISDDGEALIVLDLDDTSVQDADASAVYSTMALCGPGGYLYGVDALNTVCEKLYSTSKGKARSINYEDVLTGLKYNGPVAEYVNEQEVEKELYTTKTIGELMQEDGNSLVSTGSIKYTLTPNMDESDTTSIESYVVDSNTIEVRKIDGSTGEFLDDVDAQYVKADDTTIDVILGTLDINYWIADNCVKVIFHNNGSNRAFYSIRRGNCKSISSYPMITSRYTPGDYDYRGKGADGKVVLRPVVELADELTFTYASNTLTLN